MSYVVYILRTSGNTYYVGQTQDLAKRLQIHASKKSPSAKYLRAFSSFELVYQETCATRSAALKREAQLKSLSHLQKEQLIKPHR